MKDEFVSIVSHELRTPLTSIRGALGLVESGSLGELPPASKRMVSIALDGSVRLGRLINDILDVERIHSGVMPMNLATCSARDLVESATRQVRVLADRARIAFEIGSVEGMVVADSDRVEQTLINLLDNAIKFSPPESAVVLHTERVGSFIEFVVRDGGRGIPPEKLGSIFRRFEQVDSSDARDRGGTGLGLAISRSIIERHNGRIWAENNPDGGATFRFTLPSSSLDEPALDRSPSEDEPGQGPGIGEPAVEPQRVRDAEIGSAERPVSQVPMH
jgi:signal transduction histidine kinase